MLLNLTDLSAEPLYRQIYSQLAEKIIESELVAGDGLPSLRALAREHRVSKNTVKRAYTELARQGLIVRGSGESLLVANLTHEVRQAVSAQRPMGYESWPNAIQPLSREPVSSSYGDGMSASHLRLEPLDERRMEDELRMARQLQADLLPGEWDGSGGFSLAAYTSPSRTVGGDFYDYFAIDDGRAGLVIADASGNGMPAAMLIAQMQAILKSGVGNGDTVVRTLENLNSHLERNTAAHYFATLFYGIYDQRTGCLEYSNAGHDFPMLVRAGGGTEALESTGPALGVLPVYGHETETVRVGPGDIVLFYTDGITDAMNSNGDNYGELRLRNLLVRNRARSPREIIDLIKDDLAEFCGAGSPADDRTLMVFKVDSKEERQSDAA